MEYNTEKNIKRILDLLGSVEYDAKDFSELSCASSTEELERLWHVCLIMKRNLEEARVMIGKMLDEREDLEAEDEGE